MNGEAAAETFGTCRFPARGVSAHQPSGGPAREKLEGTF